MNELERLHAEHEAARLRAEIAAFERVARAREAHAAVVLPEAWGDVVDPKEFLFDTPGWYSGSTPWVTQPEDTRDGRFRPFFETELELHECRGVGRFFAQADGMSINILENLLNYTLDTGFKYRIEAKKEGQLKASAGLLAAVEEVVDEFLERNEFVNNFDRELFAVSRSEGEAFVALDDAGGGKTRLRRIPAECVTEPDRPEQLEDHYGLPPSVWTFGVATEPGDAAEARAYFVSHDNSGADWELIPAARMVHRKLNVPRAVKRGLPDFYPVKSDLRRNAKLFDFTVVGATIQASIAYIREAVSSGKPLDANNLGVGGFTAEILRPDGQRETANFSANRPGKIINAKGYKYTMGPMGQSSAPTFCEIVQMGIRLIGARWQMPEYMISGDASNNNMASSIVAGGPFDRATRVKQQSEANFHRQLLWKAIAAAMGKGGRLARYQLTLRQLRQMVELVIETPEVAPIDPEVQTRRRKTLHDARVLSAQTWTEKEGFDWDVEQQRIEEDEEKRLDRERKQLELQPPVAAAASDGLASPRRPKLPRKAVREHLGPGPHPNGTPQSVHASADKGGGSGGGGRPRKGRFAKKVPAGRVPKTVERGSEASIREAEARFSDASQIARLRQVPEVAFRSNVQPAEFLAAQAGMERSPYLTQHSVETLQQLVAAGGSLHLSEDGRTGYVLTAAGDLQNLFNNGGVPGAGRAALVDAMASGAVTLDCFDPHLPRLYNAFGFKAYDAWAFDDDYSPDGWDYASNARPDVVFMRYEGSRDAAEIIARIGKHARYANPADRTGYPEGQSPPSRVAESVGANHHGSGRIHAEDGLHRLEGRDEPRQRRTDAAVRLEERRQAPPGDGPAGEHQRGGLEESRQGDLQRADGRAEELTSHGDEGEHELSEISGQFGAAAYQATAYRSPADRIGSPEGNGPPGEDSGDFREGRPGGVLPADGPHRLTQPGGERSAQLREAARLLWMGYP